MTQNKLTYLQEYWTEIDLREYPHHEFEKITHCGACHKEGRRRGMRKKRNPDLDPAIARPVGRNRKCDIPLAVSQSRE